MATMSETKIVPIEFRGLNSVDPFGALRGKASAAQGIRLTPSGGIKSMGGAWYANTNYLSASGVNGEWRGLYSYNKSDGSVYIMAMQRGYCKYFTWDNLPWTQVAAGLYDPGVGQYDYYYSFATLNDVCYFGNGYDLLKSFNGVTSANVSLSADIVCSYRDRLFAVEKNSTILKWSSIADGTSFPAANYAYIGKDDGDIIKGVFPYQGSLLVLKRNTCYKVHGDDFDPTSGNYTIEQLPHVLGTISKRAVCQIGNYVMWRSPYGLYRFNGAVGDFITGGLNVSNTAIRYSDLSQIVENDEHEEAWENLTEWNYNYRLDELTMQPDFQSNKSWAWDSACVAQLSGRTQGVLIAFGDRVANVGHNEADGGATYTTDSMKLHPEKFQAKALHFIANNSAVNSGFTVSVYNDLGSDAAFISRTYLCGVNASQHHVVDLPSKYVDSMSIKFNGNKMNIAQAWLEIITKDNGDRYHANRNTIQ